MAKPPPETHRFRIHGELPGEMTLERFGYITAELTKLGLVRVGHEMVTDVATYKQRKKRANGEAKAEPAKGKRVKTKRGQSPRHEVSNKEFMLQTCFKGRDEVTAAQLNELFVKDGRHKGSAGSILSQLHSQGYVKSLGEGRWKILAKAHKLNGAESANG